MERAKDERTELHKCFTWDDTEAAEKWRRQEARFVLCHLVLVREEEPDAPQVRVFHKPVASDTYKSADFIFRRADEYQNLLQAAMAELRAFKKKYERLSELDYILDLIN